MKVEAEFSMPPLTWEDCERTWETQTDKPHTRALIITLDRETYRKMFFSLPPEERFTHHESVGLPMTDITIRRPVIFRLKE